jgi:hypothetical protein
LQEAEDRFRGYRLGLAIGAAEVADPLAQAALLTAVALGRRVFLGGVSVAGPLDCPLTVPLPLGATLAEAVATLGGRMTPVARGTPRGCKPEPQKIPPRIEKAGIFPTKELFGKVRGRSPRQSRTLMPPDATHQGSFSGKSIYGASAAGRGTSASIAVYR